MDKHHEIYQAMKVFVIRALNGTCTPQETAILPEILKLLLAPP